MTVEIPLVIQVTNLTIRIAIIVLLIGGLNDLRRIRKMMEYFVSRSEDAEDFKNKKENKQ